MANFDKKVPIYSNYPIYVDNYRELTMDELLNPSGPGVVILDEAYLYIESRTSGKGSNRIWSRILFQSRKDDRDIWIIAQLLSSVDVRFREMAEYIILCERLPGNTRLPLTGFRYTIARITNKGIKKNVKYKALHEVEPFFHLYDTKYKVTEQDQELIAATADSADLYPAVNAEVKEILGKYDIWKISKGFCKDWCREKGLTMKHAEMIYEKIQRLKA